MSLKALIVALALGVLTWPSAGHAEKAKTNQTTKVFSRAGEQSPVILKVEAGQQMTVLAKDGRWIKVRVSGRTGWVPRSKVDLPKEEDDIARNTRRRPFVDGRGTKRGFGGEVGPDDRVGADAIGEGAEPEKIEPGEDGEKPAKVAGGTEPAGGDGEDGEDSKPVKTAKVPAQDDDEEGAGGRPTARVSRTTAAFSEPDAKSEKAFTAQPRTALYVVEEKGKWTFVENDEGDAGYILTSGLEIQRPEGGPGGPRERRLDIHGRIGASLIAQRLKTAEGGMASPPDNYTAQSPSVAVAVGASLLSPVKERLWLGAELAYNFNKSVPGVGYQGVRTNFTYQIVNARVALGYETGGGSIVLGRVGVHYDAYQVANLTDFTKNNVTLPNQNILAPTIGAALMVPRLTPKVSFTASLDAIVALAKLEQTKNLEDGTDPAAKALFLGLGLAYHWSPRMALQMIADLGYTSISFGGPPPATSQRNHMGTGKITGVDFNAIMSFGVLYGF